MGFLRKVTKKIGRAIKKVGKKIGKAFKSIMKPFAKVFNKLGPLGSIAMMMILPGIGTMLSGFGANMIAGASGALGTAMGTAVQFVGNAINYVATAPQKIFGSITDAMGRGWNALTGKTPTGGPSWFDNFKKDFGTFDVSAKGQQKIMSLKNSLGIGTGPASAPVGMETFSTDLPVESIKPDLQAGLDPTKPLGVTGKPVNQMVGDIQRVDVVGTPTTATVPDATTLSEEVTADLTAGLEPEKPFTTPDKTVTEPSGVFGRGRAALTSKVGEISRRKIPYVGTVGDTAWAANAGLTAYNAYGSVVGADGQIMPSSSSYAYEAQELLGPTTDMGGIYNMTAPTWNYDYSQSYANNMTNAQNIWNTNYGFGQSFDPSATPGYGFGYEQWLLNAMGRGAA
jgi:hypothetical protein